MCCVLCAMCCVLCTVCCVVHCMLIHVLLSPFHSPSSTARYMRISVTILGPGEKAFQHDMQEVYKKEKASKEGNTDGKGAGEVANAPSLVIMPPHIVQRVEFLKIQVYHAERLPPMVRGVYEDVY